MANRFQPLMAMIASVKLTSSSSEARGGAISPRGECSSPPNDRSGALHGSLPEHLVAIR
jgi:hypothetical protein